ncbi:MAG: hypothetical protein K2G36_03265 [Ruminococcus sp.]|nr:hypothetical protein [Ruminococcus sp.]
MNDENNKIDLIVQLCRENYKLCKTMVNYLSNNNVDIERNFKNLEKNIDELKTEIHGLDKLKVTEKHIYTDDELIELKATMSWNQLHVHTKIPVSTLQYRCRRYKDKEKTSTV